MPTARSSLSCEARSARPVFGPGGLRQRASARGSAARRSSRSTVLVAHSPVALQRTISAHGRPGVRPASFVVAGPSGTPLLRANADCVLLHAKRARRSSREAPTPRHCARSGCPRRHRCYSWAAQHGRFACSRGLAPLPANAPTAARPREAGGSRSASQTRSVWKGRLASRAAAVVRTGPLDRRSEGPKPPPPVTG
jgi:hypothetical protein